jgi:hypothetical protein
MKEDAVMKRFTLVAFLLFLSSAAFADDIWFFGNTGGTLTYNPSTQTLTLTSTVTTIKFGIHDVETGNLGTLTVTTGPLTSGSILHHAFFGTSTINVAGFSATPFSGTLDFLNWYQVPNSDEFHLSGSSGELGGTGIVNFDQLVVLSGTNQFTVLKGRVGLIPEPTSMILMGTGLAGIVWRKYGRRRRASSSHSILHGPTFCANRF